jgi:hypothetical protein
MPHRLEHPVCDEAPETGDELQRGTTSRVLRVDVRADTTRDGASRKGAAP